MTNAVLKLQDSGFTREQVEALTEFMSGSVATKEDIAHLEGKIEAQGERLEGKITSEIALVRGEIEAQGERFNGKFNLLYWMFGILVAGVVSLVIKAFVV